MASDGYNYEFPGPSALLSVWRRVDHTVDQLLTAVHDSLLRSERLPPLRLSQAQPRYGHRRQARIRFSSSLPGP